MGMETYGRTLTHTVLTALVREFVPPKDMLGKKIFKSGPRDKVFGHAVGIDVITNPRHITKARHPDAPAGKQALKTIKHLDVTLPTLKEEKLLPASILTALRKPGTEHQQYGRAAVTEELDGLDIIIENTLEKWRWDLLQTGIISQTAASVDEVPFSIDFGIDATNSTPALAGDNRWSVAASCDPIGDILDWKQKYARLCGKVAKFGIMTSTVMNYLRNSTSVQAMMGDRLKDEIAMLGRLRELCELELKIYDQGYVPVGGSFTNFLGTDKFIMWSGDTHREYDGQFNDLEAKGPGKFSKTWEDPNPSGIHILEGTCRLPSAERIKEFFCATVHA